MSTNADKLCRVCGDIGFSKHFNGQLTCISCKSFFARQSRLSNIDKLVCRFDGNCKVTKNNRKFCQKCRLLLCFQIGMKKELVFFHKKEKSKANIVCQTDSASKEFELSSLELELISHLNEAGKTFVDEQTLPRTSTVISDITIAINLPSLYISRIAKFCNQFNAFTCLSDNDKITIVKGFFTECVSTRMAFNFEEENDGVLLYESELATKSILLQIFRFTDVHESDRKKFRNFHFSLKTELENDSTLRELVIAIFLFGKRNNITFPEHLRFQYFIYKNLLFRYLICKYKNETQAKTKHNNLMSLMADFAHINFKIHELHGKIDPIMQSPIVHELFNLL